MKNSGYKFKFLTFVINDLSISSDYFIISSRGEIITKRIAIIHIRQQCNQRPNNAFL